MLCRLCLVDDNNYRNLENGAICDMLRAVLRKKCIQISSPVICSSCVKKIETVFDFKTTCLNTQKIISLYGGSCNKTIYVNDNKLCVSTANNVKKVCRICLKLIENGFCSNLLDKFDILQILAMYMPEMVIMDKEASLICFKCSDHFRIFSELLSIIEKTENMIAVYCTKNGVSNTEEISLADVLVKETKGYQNTVEDNIIKLLNGKDHFLLDLENDFESTYLSDSMKDSKKRIIKKIIEEDVDLFYKEKPDFDSVDLVSEENGIGSDHGDIFFGPQPRQLLMSDSEEDLQRKRMRESIEEEEFPLRLSFETEDSSLSPGNSDRNFYESESQDEGKKDDREVTSPNPFIFFNNYGQAEESCDCNESNEGSPSELKRKSCEKCMWKKALGYTSDDTDTNKGTDDVVTKKPKKDGKKKCRKAYGIEFKEMWCTQCRWKKACTRFGNGKAVSRR